MTKGTITNKDIEIFRTVLNWYIKNRAYFSTFALWDDFVETQQLFSSSKCWIGEADSIIKTIEQQKIEREPWF